MAILLKATLIVLLYFQIKLCSSVINKPISSFTKFSPADESETKLSRQLIRSIYSRNLPSLNDNLMIKRNELIDQDFVSMFEHPNRLIEFNKKIDTSLESKLDQDTGQQLESPNGKSHLNPQSLTNNVQTKLGVRTMLPNKKLTRIRFLVGSNDEDRLKNKQPKQDQLNKKELDNLLSEPSESANTLPLKRANNRNEFIDEDYELIPVSRNLRNRLNNPFSHLMGLSVIKKPNNQFQNQQINNFMNNQLNNEARDQFKKLRAKKALSLFAHWKPVEADNNNYLTRFSPELSFYPKAFSKVSSRSQLYSARPLGQPLRWG